MVRDRRVSGGKEAREAFDARLASGLGVSVSGVERRLNEREECTCMTTCSGSGERDKFGGSLSGMSEMDVTHLPHVLEII